ncbi:hypothetical protein BDP67DRAFT_491436 [Colletotrichum lupini]|nr:hypothetical protein BDP67DRAFT_491436 [Colletotrichum lupini]
MPPKCPCLLLLTLSHTLIAVYPNSTLPTSHVSIPVLLSVLCLFSGQGPKLLNHQLRSYLLRCLSSHAHDRSVRYPFPSRSMQHSSHPLMPSNLGVCLSVWLSAPVPELLELGALPKFAIPSRPASNLLHDYFGSGIFRRQVAAHVVTSFLIGQICSTPCRLSPNPSGSVVFASLEHDKLSLRKGSSSNLGTDTALQLVRRRRAPVTLSGSSSPEIPKCAPSDSATNSASGSELCS